MTDTNQPPPATASGLAMSPGERLGLRIVPTASKGAIHLTKEETAEEPLVHRPAGDKSPH